jgi:dihydrodipicolinate synthase/N-acetylneuraminate lyase
MLRKYDEALRNIRGFSGDSKYALGIAGLPCGECRKPFLPISSQKMELIKTSLVSSGILKS